MGKAGNAIEKLVAGRWIAGANDRDAIAVAKYFNSKKIRALINFLGEAYTKEEDIAKTIDIYLRLIRYIENEKVTADITVKPTQLGLLISNDEFVKNYKKIINAARGSKVFTWMDMEEAEYIDDALAAYEEEVDNGMVGICIQSYLKRSIDDLRKLTKKDAVIRLVKGAYTASKNKSFQTRSETTENYYKLMNFLFENGKSFTIATHDIDIIHEAIKLNKNSKKDVTFAMLKGIRNKLAVQLAEKEKVSIYVPFGEEWIPYSYRRLKEAGHLKLILRSLFESQSI
ncbi:MAG: proline dehydrogenase family protein [Candidatus Marsarchaeota archaeon]|nr:proline dehydrogenase family protein [Candidatus Marsarchaeota archaeon]MCL5434257.1 proline dehydrogenase family protein [Candidatus Marsarchaeota archaeon]